MTTTANAAGSAPAPKSLVARFIGIIIAPRDTFQSIVPFPKWLGMLALTTVLSAFFTALPMTTDAGKQAAIENQVQQLQSFGVQVSDQMSEQMEKGAGRIPYTTGISILFVAPIIAVIFSGILFAIFNAALGGEASFKQLFAVFVHAGAVSTVSAVVSGVVNYFSGRVGSVTNLGALMPMLPEKSFGANLLGTVDIFLIWYLIVLAIGLGVLYKRRTQPIAITFMSIYGVIALAIALLKSRGGA
jgi:membrane protein, antimicrobial resistance system